MVTKEMITTLAFTECLGGQGTVPKAVGVFLCLSLTSSIVFSPVFTNGAAEAQSG